ncbi:hypothetical protein J6590_044092 [Homalodisca vitripennis]|nr:hypothetical protein J6590_044092 [Homalodisca vitripennis]
MRCHALEGVASSVWLELPHLRAEHELDLTAFSISVSPSEAAYWSGILEQWNGPNNTSSDHVVGQLSRQNERQRLVLPILRHHGANHSAHKHSPRKMSITMCRRFFCKPYRVPDYLISFKLVLLRHSPADTGSRCRRVAYRFMSLDAITIRYVPTLCISEQYLRYTATDTALGI